MAAKCQNDYDDMIMIKKTSILITAITFNTARLENKSKLFISAPVVAISDAK